MVIFFCSPKLSPEFVEDVLPEMESRSEILGEEHLRKVRLIR